MLRSMHGSTRSLLSTLALSCALAAAPRGARAAAPSFVIHDNTPGFVKQAARLGAVDSTSVISVNVWLNLHNDAQLAQLAHDVSQRGSASFRQWQTEAQLEAAFSPTAQEVAAVQQFLAAQNLTVTYVAENRLYVKAQGTVADVQKAFHVNLDNFSFRGETHRSNSSDPVVNNAAGGLIAAVTGLDDFGFQPHVALPQGPDGAAFAPKPLVTSPNGLFFEGQCLRGVESHTFTSPGVTAVYTGNRYGANIDNTALGHLAPCGYSPRELQTAYGLRALYAAGLTGAGQTVVITDAFGSATITTDAEVFSQVYGLPDLTPANFQIVKAAGLGQNPFGPARNWALETTLDVEWVHATAPGANIALVVATDRSSLDEAINLAVVRDLGSTISNSWGIPEGLGNPRQLDRVTRILQLAAAKGIDVNFSSGDFGDEVADVGFKTVSFPASSPLATGIGGTSLFLNPDDTIAFQTGWGDNLTRIANTRAEGNSPVDPPLHLGFQFGAGGGASLTFPKPAFQAGLPGTARLVPDIAMLADPQTGAEFIETIDGVLSVGVVGGTSLAAPMFSAIWAIATQKAGHPLGQAAPQVYGLPAGAVSDILPVTSPNNVTGTITDAAGTTTFTSDQLAAPLDGITTYLSALYNSPFSTRWFVLTFGTDTSLTVTPGWDEVTGVGTPNAAAFVNAVAGP
jgi:subtilase family serine protease